MRSREYQKGMALVSALLLLLVTTMLGVAMFRSFGFLESVAGNTREKQRALHAAESAQTNAEWWLGAAGGLNATTGSNCSGGLVASASAWTVCSNALANPATIPWAAGMAYTPNGMTTGSVGTLNNYYLPPAFYISFLSNTFDRTSGAQINNYQIDAMGYGGTNNSAAVVESGYTVSVLYNSDGSLRKFINLGNP
ncbi:MAG TPA: PilX N-terminal domain-containing pilus assembly protein [Steroidobacteraceae bacterium]